MELKKYKQQEFREVMIELVKLFIPAVYVEIGIQKGYTFNAISPLVKRAIAVDTATAPKIVKANNVEVYQMDSTEFTKSFKGEIDLLFIDADHRKNSVLLDFDNLSPFVKEGTGLIFLHDTYPMAEHLLSDRFCSNAWEAAYEIRTNKKYKDFEIVTLPGPYAGISIIRKAPKHLHWFTPVVKEITLEKDVPISVQDNMLNCELPEPDNLSTDTETKKPKSVYKTYRRSQLKSQHSTESIE